MSITKYLFNYYLILEKTIKGLECRFAILVLFLRKKYFYKYILRLKHKVIVVVLVINLLIIR